jgi:hypothetical protein
VGDKAIFTVCMTAILTVAVTVFAETPSAPALPVSPATQPVGDVAGWFRQLADDDPAVRDTARLNLMGLKREQLDDLRKVVEENESLAPAQQAALHDIVFQVWLSGEDYERIPQGFMGVLLQEVHQAAVAAPDDAPDGAAQWRGWSGVLIAQRVPGFCGFRYLQDDDLIVAVMSNDVIRVSEVIELTSLVKATAPGDTLTLQLIRQGKPMRVSFRVDARPIKAGQSQQEAEEFRNLRLSMAQEYWDKTFAPLLAAKLS